MSWILNWYESKAPRDSVPDPEKDKGDLIKRTIGWLGLFDYDTVELCKTDRVIMEGYCPGVPPIPTTDDPLWLGVELIAWLLFPIVARVGSDDGMRLYAGPFNVLDEWKIRTYIEKTFTLWIPHSKAPWFKIQYFNSGGSGRVRFGMWWLKKE